jgi:hypothetical protein
MNTYGSVDFIYSYSRFYRARLQVLILHDLTGLLPVRWNDEVGGAVKSEEGRKAAASRRTSK